MVSCADVWFRIWDTVKAFAIEAAAVRNPP